MKSTLQAAVTAVLLFAVPMNFAQGTKVDLGRDTKGQLPYSRITGTPIVDIDTFAGADLGAKLTAANAAYAPGTSVIFGTEGGTLPSNAAVTLSDKHSLAIMGPVQWNGYIVPTTNNTVACFGGAASTITSGMSSSSPNADGVNAFFWSPAGSTEVTHFQVSGCTFNGYGSHSGYIFESHGPTQDVSIINNDAIYATLYMQQSAAPSNPSLRLTVTGNTCDWTGSVQNSGATCVLSYGALQHAIISTNHFYAPYYGVELFASTSTGQIGSNFPSETQIQTSGLQDDLVEGNDCHNVVSCAWTSMATRVSLTANEAYVCADVCFDHESGTFNTGSANTATQSVNGAFAEEYGGWYNTWIGNIVHGGQGFLITAPTTGTTVIGNHYDNQNSVGIFFYMENTANGVRIVKNDVVDGLLAYAITYASRETVDGNTFFFDAVIPSSNVGSPSGSGCGISLGDFQDATFANATNNTVITTVPQTVPALCAGLSQDNTAETVRLVGDTLQGPWGTDVYLNSSSTNNAVVHNFELRGLEFASGIVKGHSPTAPINVVCRGGGNGGASSVSVSYSFNSGTATALACN